MIIAARKGPSSSLMPKLMNESNHVSELKVLGIYRPVWLADTHTATRE